MMWIPESVKTGSLSSPTASPYLQKNQKDFQVRRFSFRSSRCFLKWLCTNEQAKANIHTIIQITCCSPTYFASVLCRKVPSPLLVCHCCSHYIRLLSPQTWPLWTQWTHAGLKKNTHHPALHKDAGWLKLDGHCSRQLIPQ